MSWRDDEIDDLFRDAAEQQYFEFKPEYFKDIEKELPIRRSRKPFIWWFSSSVFLMFFLGWTVQRGIDFEHNDIAANEQTASNEVNSPAQIVTESSGQNGVNDVVSDDQNLSEVKSDRNIGLVQNKEVHELALNTIGSQVEIDLSSIQEPSAETESSQVDNGGSEVIGTLELSTINTGHTLGELSSSGSYSESKRKLSLYMEMGGAIGQGWVSTNPATVNGGLFINGGISASMGRFNITGGLGLRASKLGDLEIMERTKIYGFGYSTYENRYTFNSLYALETPVQINYVQGRHAIGIGVVPSYNLCTGLTRTEWIDGVQMVERSGVSDVGLFSKFGIAGSFGYSYFVKENMQIGARGAIQLIEPLSSDRFVGERVKMPFEGQVFIRRTIEFKK